MGLKLRKRRKDYIYASQILKSIDLFYHHNKDDEFNVIMKQQERC